jgi:uncharacterized protein YutE (UPF0331/DUF86 family)
MSPLAERLADVRQQLRHVAELREQIENADALRSDLGLRNDLLLSLLVICQGVIDVAAELASRQGIRFQDYTEAVRALAQMEDFPPALVDRLADLPGFRNVLVHDYVELDYERVVDAARELQPVEEFVRIVAAMELDEGSLPVD